MTPLKPAAIRIGKNESGNRTGMLLKAFLMFFFTIIYRFTIRVDCIQDHVSVLMCYVRVSGYVYVDLHSEEQVEKALKKNKDYIGEKYFILYPINFVHDS